MYSLATTHEGAHAHGMYMSIVVTTAPAAVAAASAAAAAPAELALASSHVSGAAFGDAAPATALASPAAAADARAHPRAGVPRHCAYSCRAASRAARGGFARDAQHSSCADWRGLAATPSPACARAAFGGTAQPVSLRPSRSTPLGHVSGAASGGAAPATALASPAAAADARAHARSSRTTCSTNAGAATRDAQHSPRAARRGLEATPPPACARAALGGTAQPVSLRPFWPPPPGLATPSGYEAAPRTPPTGCPSSRPSRGA